MHLNVLLEPKLDLPRLTQVLDELGHLARIDTIRGWSKKTQATLFEAVAGHKKISLDDFVPPGIEPLVEVIHHGQNTLLPGFDHFQKRFCKLPDDPKQLAGYNHQRWAWADGPGYFLARASDAEGEVDIDYRTIPKVKPAAWPEIRDNESGIARLVHGGMVDVMRGISSHVTIGRAKRHGKWLDAWFVLCREDPTPPS